MEREAIRPAEARPTPYLHALRTGDIIWVAGEVGLKQDGTLAGPDVESQARQAFENIRLALAEAGATLDDIVHLRNYLVNRADIPGYQAARRAVLNQVPPSTLLLVAGLVSEDLLVEIEAVAVRRPKSESPFLGDMPLPE